jgi:hypothetical protein
MSCENGLNPVKRDFFPLRQDISYGDLVVSPFMVHAAQALALRATSSPRTDHETLKINYLTVRPEHVEG